MELDESAKNTIMAADDDDDDDFVSTVQIIMYRCNVCSEQFTDRLACKQHAKTHRKAGNKPQADGQKDEGSAQSGIHKECGNAELQDNATRHQGVLLPQESQKEKDQSMNDEDCGDIENKTSERDDNKTAIETAADNNTNSNSSQGEYPPKGTTGPRKATDTTDKYQIPQDTTQQPLATTVDSTRAKSDKSSANPMHVSNNKDGYISLKIPTNTSANAEAESSRYVDLILKMECESDEDNPDNANAETKVETYSESNKNKSKIGVCSNEDSHRGALDQVEGNMDTVIGTAGETTAEDTGSNTKNYKGNWVVDNTEYPKGSLVQATKVGDISKSWTIKGTYICAVCQQVFGDTHSFKEHFLSHAPATQASAVYGSKEQRYVVERPTSSTTVKLSGKEGISNLHRCSICQANFPTRAMCMAHMLSHIVPIAPNNLEIYECNICHKRFSQKALCNSHMQSEHANYEETVAKTPKYKKNTNLLPLKKQSESSQNLPFSNEPVLLKESGQGYRCSTCHRVFISERIGEVHIKQHVDDQRKKESMRRSKTSNMGKDTQMKSKNTWRRMEPDLGPQVNMQICICSICQQAFATQSLIKTHMDLHLASAGMCTVCGLMYETQTLLRSHMARHKTKQDMTVKKSKLSLKCLHCGSIELENKAHLAEHLIESHKDKVLLVDTKTASHHDHALNKKEDTEENSDLEDDSVGSSDHQEDLADHPMIQDGLLEEAEEVEAYAPYVEEDLDQQLAKDLAKIEAEYDASISALEKEHKSSAKQTKPLIFMEGQEFREVSLESLFIRRIRTFNAGGLVQCHLCNIGFESDTQLTNHIKIDHTLKVFLGKDEEKYEIKKKIFVCDLCGKEFKSSAGLINHKAAHTSDGTPKCGLCLLEFDNEIQLREHMKSEHDNNWPYQCDECFKGFFDLILLGKHKLHHKTSSQKNYECTICSRTFRFRWDMINHRSVHTNERPFECELCGTKMRLRKYLKKHMASCTGSSTGTAEGEEKNPQGKKKRKRKKKTPMGPMEVQCQVCGKQIQHKSLRRHLQRHEDEDEGKMYPCNQCSAEFESNRTLKIHKRITHFPRAVTQNAAT